MLISTILALQQLAMIIRLKVFPLFFRPLYKFYTSLSVWSHVRHNMHHMGSRTSLLAHHETAVQLIAVDVVVSLLIEYT